jgi:peptidoglycan/xylan/chitin deacetylase (PgdA/CDA1 family)
MSRATVAILTYHSVAPRTTAGFRRWTVDPLQFAEHLDAVRERAVDVITVDEVPDALESGRPSVAITLDDGLADVAEHAVPVLAERDLTATVFVPSHYIGRSAAWLPGEDGRRALLSHADLIDLDAHGFEIGSHGHRHLAADVHPAGIVMDDAGVSRRELEICIGRPVRSFAYPFGYHSRTARRAVREAGYAQACAVGDLPARPADDRWALPRLQVFGHTTTEDLVKLITCRPAAPARRWSGAKQSIWRAGRRWAGWGPAEAGRLYGGLS